MFATFIIAVDRQTDPTRILQLSIDVNKIYQFAFMLSLMKALIILFKAAA